MHDTAVTRRLTPSTRSTRPDFRRPLPHSDAPVLSPAALLGQWHSAEQGLTSAEAQRRLAEGKQFGKIVLRV